MIYQSNTLKGTVRRERSALPQIRAVFVGIVFFASLAVSYLFFVSDLFAYMGFATEVNSLRIAISIVTIALFGLATKCNEDVISFFQLAAFFSYLCPALIIYSLGGASQAYFNTAIIGLVTFYLSCHAPIRSIVVVKGTFKIMLVFCLSITVLTSLSIVLFGGGAYFSLDLASVYEFRDVAAGSLPAIFAYIISPVSKVILPIGIIAAIYCRSTLLTVMFLSIGVILFGLSHHKSVVAIPFATFVLYFCLNRFGIARGFAILFLFVSAAAAGEAFFLRTFAPDTLGPISTYIVRRVFLVPPLLDNFYIDFFSRNEYFYWAASRVTFGLVDTSYRVPAPFLIGYDFFGSDEMSANTGFIGSGFSNAGLLGVVIYASLIGLIVAALNAMGRRIGPIIVICCSFSVVVTALTTSDLITVFLSHGLAILFVLLTFMPRQKT